MKSWYTIRAREGGAEVLIYDVPGRAWRAAG